MHTIKNPLISFILVALFLISGCATQKIVSTTSPEYKGKINNVKMIGLTGQGASVAFYAFVEQGYRVKEINSGNKNIMVVAREKSIPYVAKIDKVGTDGAWWDGVFDFSMRVIDVSNETIVWSAYAEYGSGATIRQVEQTKKAMSDMVKDFSKTFPSAK
jgi:hypothetical protein